MKRRLTLAFGCLACAMPSVASVASPQAGRTASTTAHESGNSSFVIRHSSFLTLPAAAQAAQGELEARGLGEGHSIASIIFLKGTEPATGHYDVRIEPPAPLADGSRLRGFSIALNGAIQPATDFRTGSGATLSTQPPAVALPERNLRSVERAG